MAARAGAKRAGKALKHAKGSVSPYLKVTIPSGMASSAPPLGPQLGQHGINIGEFCKRFNEKTKDIKTGLPLPTEIRVKGDRSIDIKHAMPTTAYFLCMAAGVTKGAMEPGKEIAGKVTLRHVYEIAAIKKSEGTLDRFSLESVCKMIIGTAHSMGIEVEKDLDPEEYGEFITQREAVVEDQERLLQEEKEAKYLRL